MGSSPFHLKQVSWDSAEPGRNHDRPRLVLSLLQLLKQKAAGSPQLQISGPAHYLRLAMAYPSMDKIYQKSSSAEYEMEVEKDLAGHTTQGAHGVNYHHAAAGDQGSTFFMPCKSLLGEGALVGAVSQVKALGQKKALIVTDAVLVKVGAAKALTEVLDDAGIGYVIYDGCLPNPTVAQVDAGVKMLKDNNCDFVVSFGGGSPHDCAKAISMLCANGGSIKDYEGVDKSTKPMLPLVAVNTTAGTGAEMTRFCIITDEVRHVKMALVDWRLTPTLAVPRVGKDSLLFCSSLDMLLIKYFFQFVLV